MKYQFKKGDLVRCIDILKPVIKSVGRLIVGEIYMINRDIPTGDSIQLDESFGKFKKIRDINSLGRFHPYRFEKVSKKELTEDEKFMYIKWKLGE